MLAPASVCHIVEGIYNLLTTAQYLIKFWTFPVVSFLQLTITWFIKK